MSWQTTRTLVGCVSLQVSGHKTVPSKKLTIPLCADRCRKVIELARKYKLLVISDDVYNLIYHDKPPTRLFSYDNKYMTLNCVYNYGIIFAIGVIQTTVGMLYPIAASPRYLVLG